MNLKAMFSRRLYSRGVRWFCTIGFSNSYPIVILGLCKILNLHSTVVSRLVTRRL